MGLASWGRFPRYLAISAPVPTSIPDISSGAVHVACHEASRAATDQGTTPSTPNWPTVRAAGQPVVSPMAPRSAPTCWRGQDHVALRILRGDNSWVVQTGRRKRRENGSRRHGCNRPNPWSRRSRICVDRLPARSRGSARGKQVVMWLTKDRIYIATEGYSDALSVPGAPSIRPSRRVRRQSSAASPRVLSASRPAVSNRPPGCREPQSNEHRRSTSSPKVGPWFFNYWIHPNASISDAPPGCAPNSMFGAIPQG